MDSGAPSIMTRPTSHSWINPLTSQTLSFLTHEMGILTPIGLLLQR